MALGIHPNMLTLIGVLINVGAAWALGRDRFLLAGVIMIVANIFDFIDGKVAHITNTVSRFGAFWDSTLDRFSDIALFLGLIYLYADAAPHRLRDGGGAGDDVLDHDQLRARARRVADREVQGRLHGAARAHRPVHDRRVHRTGMAAVMWVILILSIVTVANRIHYTYLALNDKPIPTGSNPITRGVLARVLLARRAGDAPLRPVGRSPSWRSSG